MLCNFYYALCFLKHKRLAVCYNEAMIYKGWDVS